MQTLHDCRPRSFLVVARPQGLVLIVPEGGQRVYELPCQFLTQDFEIRW